MNDYNKANAFFFTALCIYIYIAISNISKSYPYEETPPPLIKEIPKIHKAAKDLNKEVQALRANIVLSNQEQVISRP